MIHVVASVKIVEEAKKHAPCGMVLFPWVCSATHTAPPMFVALSHATSNKVVVVGLPYRYWPR